MEKSFVLVVITILSLISVVTAVPGTAVFYKRPYTPSACFQNQDKGVMIAGVSDALWDNGRACGKRYSVRCTGATNTFPRPCKNSNSIVVTIVDYCRAPCYGLINLSQDAFEAIAETDAGNIKIDYTPEIVADEQQRLFLQPCGSDHSTRA